LRTYVTLPNNSQGDKAFDPHSCSFLF